MAEESASKTFLKRIGEQLAKGLANEVNTRFGKSGSVNDSASVVAPPPDVETHSEKSDKEKNTFRDEFMKMPRLSAIPELKINIKQIDIGDEEMNNVLNEAQGELIHAIRISHQMITEQVTAVQKSVNILDTNIRQINKKVDVLPTSKDIDDLSRRLKKLETKKPEVKFTDFDLKKNEEVKESSDKEESGSGGIGWKTAAKGGIGGAAGASVLSKGWLGRLGMAGLIYGGAAGGAYAESKRYEKGGIGNLLPNPLEDFGDLIHGRAPSQYGKSEDDATADINRRLNEANKNKTPGLLDRWFGTEDNSDIEKQSPDELKDTKVDRTEITLTAKERIFISALKEVNIKSPRIVFDAQEIIFKGRVHGLNAVNGTPNEEAGASGSWSEGTLSDIVKGYASGGLYGAIGAWTGASRGGGGSNGGWGGRSSSASSGGEPPPQLTQEQQTAYDALIKSGQTGMSVDDPQLSFLKNLDENSLKSGGLEKYKGEDGKEYYRALPGKSSSISDSKIADMISKESGNRGIAAKDIGPEGAAVLNMLSKRETGGVDNAGYGKINYKAGGGETTDFSHHPFEGKKGTTASGRYQQLASNYDRYSDEWDREHPDNKVPVENGHRIWTPEWQDRIGLQHAIHNYKANTGRDLLEDMKDSNNYSRISASLGREWAVAGPGYLGEEYNRQKEIKPSIKPEDVSEEEIQEKRQKLDEEERKNEASNLAGLIKQSSSVANDGSSHVVERQSQVARIRKGEIQPELKEQLNYAAIQNDVQVEVFSGGQRMPGAEGATGSHRHDHGNAADLKLYRLDENGKKVYLNMNNPEDRQVMKKFLSDSVKAGATGIGAAEDYMGPESMHIGGGSQAAWGAGGSSRNAPDWVTQALQEGTEERKTFDFEKWKKDQEKPQVAKTKTPKPIEASAASIPNLPSISTVPTLTTTDPVTKEPVMPEILPEWKKQGFSSQNEYNLDHSSPLPQANMSPIDKNTLPSSSMDMVKDSVSRSQATERVDVPVKQQSLEPPPSTKSESKPKEDAKPDETPKKHETKSGGFKADDKKSPSKSLPAANRHPSPGDMGSGDYARHPDGSSCFFCEMS